MTLAEEVFAPTAQEKVQEAAPEQTIPVLQTERLRLRAPRQSDAKAIAVLANDLRVAANTARLPHPYGVDDAEQFIAATNKRSGEACFAVTFEHKPIGICSIARGEDFEIGYWFGFPYWGRGFATEAARAVIDHAFGDPAQGGLGHGGLGHEVLLSSARVSNPASRRVLEKCGFQWTGVRLHRIRAINSSAPIDQFRLDRRLWASLKSWGRAAVAV